MGMLARILGIGSSESLQPFQRRTVERRSSPTSWDLMHADIAGAPVGPYLAENLSAVFSCVQCIAETVATLPLLVYRKEGDGKSKSLSGDHPVARLFSRAPNTLQ